MFGVTVFALALLAGGAVGQLPANANLFQVDIHSFNDPGVIGAIDGKMYYRKSVGGTDVQRIDWTISGSGPPAYSSVSEIIDYTNQFRYLFCTSCEAETYRKDQVNYNPALGTQNPSARWAALGIDTFTHPSYGLCTGKVVASAPAGQGEVVAVYKNAAGTICRTIQDDPDQGGLYDLGRHIDFDNWAAVTPNNAIFTGNTAWNCPAPQCSVKIELFLVMDESGSVRSSDFTLEKQFGVDVVNSYTIGPDDVRVGLSIFNGGSRLIFGLRSNKQNIINDINAVNQRGGSTCIPCGMATARQSMVGARRAGIGMVMIVLTDGGNNVGNMNECETTINAGILTFGIGVGGGVVQSQVLRIAGGVSSRAIFTPSFSGLSAILQQLITETCTDLPGNPCGPTCRGFCSCNQQCLCPTSCQSADACKTGTCVVGQNGNGCTLVTKTCSDGDECTLDTCVSAGGVGCQNPTKTCDDTNECTIDTCNSALTGGCVFTPKNCDDNNPCTQDLCIPATGCNNATTVPCAACQSPFAYSNGVDPCAAVGVSDVCNARNCKQTNTSGVIGAICEVVPTDCDDGNACTVDTCSVALGGCQHTNLVCDDNDACTSNMCSSVDQTGTGGPAAGCYYPTLDCNDNNNCTTDSCNPTGNNAGCANTPISCSDGDICTDDTCNSILGCLYPAVDCSKNPQIARFQGNCHFAFCLAARGGCYLEHINGTAPVDDCGICGGDGSTCATNNLESSAVIGIAGGFIALIVIGAVILCAALAFIGGKKGYDVYMRNKGSMFGASSSPLYDSGNLQGQSALYEGEA